jgi:hypothetical protein
VGPEQFAVQAIQLGLIETLAGVVHHRTCIIEQL